MSESRFVVIVLFVVAQKAQKVKSLANPIARGIYRVVESPCPGTLVDKTGHSV